MEHDRRRSAAERDAVRRLHLADWNGVPGARMPTTAVRSNVNQPLKKMASMNNITSQYGAAKGADLAETFVPGLR